MKRFIALLVSALMLFSACALAEEVLYTAEDGTTVTLAMKGEYSIRRIEVEDEVDRWEISREGVASVYIVIAPLEDAIGLNDLTDEEIEDIIALDMEGNEDVLTIEVKVTPSGNKYLDYFWDEEGVQVEERWTYFDGFEFNRLQGAEVLTEADTAFLAEVQEGMWVTVPEAK